ncbi:MAG: hypothetical protein U9P14_06885 [Gemmatimonadota bacterium]|nr:hypothetical protein [Gemmatimonadota bacterium]
MAETEYLNHIKNELLRRDEELKVRCKDCRRECGHTPEEKMECLANLMTLEYLIDHHK